MTRATTAWNKIHQEMALILPSVRAGFQAMNQHKPMIGCLALTTIFGAVADRGASTELLDAVLTAAGWLSMPYCWGRASIAHEKQRTVSPP